MFFDSLKFFTGVVVKNSDLGIISAYYNPLLPGYKFSASNWSISNLKRPDLSLLVIIEDSDVSGIESNEHPR